MCECKSQIESQLVARLKANYPAASAHSATLEGYGFAIVDGTMTLQPFMPVKYGAGFENKKTGRERWKTMKGSMVFTFCPFCGVKLAKDKA